MRKRIILVHAYKHSIPPIEKAFLARWPEAEALSLLDESIYADADPAGTINPSVRNRIRTLLVHCVESGADGVVFTGSTFGPIVEEARTGLSIPVLKADEAMAHAAVLRGGKLLLVCTAGRAVPVIAANIYAAATQAGVAVDLATLVVPDAKEAISRGALEEHDRLVAQAIVDAPFADSVLLGQISMANVPPLLPTSISERILTSPEASVDYLRAILVPSAPQIGS